ncbi:UDP-2,4-diacetamido-2,4,6-trideoxy-beta-L-altropyranose hydrolase [soil metagenome]
MQRVSPEDSPRTEVWFRVDADRNIGSGHLVRCGLLADALGACGIRSTFLVDSTPDELCKSLEDGGHSVRRLRAGKLLPETMAEGAPSLLVIDLDRPEYYDTQWQQSLRARGVRLMMITFRSDRRFAADLVLNQNLLASAAEASLESGAKLLLGPRFALLAPEFRALHERPPRTVEMSCNVLVTFGGADRRDLTSRTVTALSRMEVAPRRLVVVVGSLYSRLAELEAMLAEHDELNTELQVATERMPELMGEADLAVTSGGLTAWELACAGVPNVIVSSSERERLTGVHLDRQGLAHFAGHHDQTDGEAIRGAVEELLADVERRRGLAFAGRRLVDGRGLDRVLETMLALINPARLDRGVEHGT